MIVSENNEGIMLVLIVKVDGIICCVLIDIGVGSLYVFVKLLDFLKKKLSEMKIRCVDMLISLKVIKLEVYDIVVEFLDGNY